MTLPAESAPAKVNLFLHVTGRRPDGYHLLDSVAVFADVADRLTMDPDASGLCLRISGPFAAAVPPGADNLVLRAVRALAAAAGVTACGALTLEKNLPVAAGIGGGSSDAAAALRLAARAWGVTVPDDRLMALAASLGADVPVCLRPMPWRMSGAGEVLSASPDVPPCGLVLVNPGVAVATADVFAARAAAFSRPAVMSGSWRDVAEMAVCLAATRNDLEEPAGRLAPAIGETLAALNADPACLLARMSGSGATCFGLTSTPAEAVAVAGRLARTNWWVWGGGLARPSVATGAVAA